MSKKIYDLALRKHRAYKGKLHILSAAPLKNKADLSWMYTPGVAGVSLAISKKQSLVNELTIKSHTVGVVTDGSAVLGLGNIGPEAAMPVMEGKAVLFKEMAGLDAFPICIRTQETDKLVEIVENIAPVFGAINLEDISAPRCFEVEARLQNLGIPVMHDDQHGTAIVVRAGLLNASKVTKKKFKDLKVVVNGAGAAGVAVAKLLGQRLTRTNYEIVREVVMVDSQGVIYQGRKNLVSYKKELARWTNKKGLRGGLEEAMSGADVFIGVSAPGVLKPAMIKNMNARPIIFALANPIPEIMPEEAHRLRVGVIATGRSDFPNQVNNALAFPGVFKGALEGRARAITIEMKIAASEALARLVKKPTAAKILPEVLDSRVSLAVSKAVRRQIS
ncbi:MAG: NADP-dependent malic enzyme [Anaplasmataceae bacterium]|nr:NADP-dependent malic enzyme [Anaplasmataceae bacterium]